MGNIRERKCKEPQIPVLIFENIFVHKDVYSYVVTEHSYVVTNKNSTASTCDVNARRYRPTYHPELSDAVYEVSKRLFNRKLAKRAKAKLLDFESLVQLVKEHKEEIHNGFSLQENQMN